MKNETPQGTSFRCPQDRLTIIVQIIRFLQDLRSREHFRLKAIVPKKKKILVTFFSYYPPCLTSSSSLLGSTRYFVNYGGKYKIISLTKKKMQITKSYEKALPLSEEKFGQIFLVFSSITNVRQHIIRTHNVFWQVLCKLYDHIFNILRHR